MAVDAVAFELQLDYLQLLQVPEYPHLPSRDWTPRVDSSTLLMALIPGASRM
jgi:hypothetical protein